MTWSSDWTAVATGTATPQPPASSWPLEDLVLPPAGGHAQAAQPDAPDAVELEAVRRQAELEEAYSKGFDDGVAECRRLEGERVTQALAAIDEAGRALAEAQAPWVEQAESNLCALAVAIAQHVINRELKGDPHAIADLVRRALAHFPVDEPVRIRIHPQDLSTISAAGTGGEGGLRIAAGRSVQWLADAKLKTGGCVVEGRRRVVDGRVDHALERAYRRLLDA